MQRRKFIKLFRQRTINRNIGPDGLLLDVHEANREKNVNSK